VFFFDDPGAIREELGNGSILVIEAQRSPRWRARADPLNRKGTYNVGLLQFRRTTAAFACLRRWRERCIEWCFDRVKPDRFGDQRYLDEWPTRYEGVVVSEHRGVGLAPWNLENHRLSYTGGRTWVDADPLLLYHFSGLRLITPWLYDPGLRPYGIDMGPVTKHHIYVPYVRELRRTRQLIHAAGGKTSSMDNVRLTRNKLLLLARMAGHRSFLVVTDRFAL
jgi:hypothetical protein